MATDPAASAVQGREAEGGGGVSTGASACLLEQERSLNRTFPTDMGFHVPPTVPQVPKAASILMG